MASGLDLVARKSLESGSEASILISGSSSLFLQNQGNEEEIESDRHENWSWNHLKDQFSIKNATPLFLKYQSRLQHTLLMTSLTVNTISGFIYIFIFWLMSEAPPEEFKLVLTVKCATTTSSFVLYVMTYQESWFLNDRSRLASSVLVTIITLASEVGSSIVHLAAGQVPGMRFSSYPLLIVAIFLPYPKWHQVVIATFCVITSQLTIDGLSMHMAGHLSPNQLIADISYQVGLSLLGLFIRFLMEFTNRKAFLDRRECFENKFHLQYEKEQEEQLLLSVLPKHISSQVRDGIRESISRMNEAPSLHQRPFTELFVEKHRNVSILYADIVNSVVLTASLNVSDLVETLNELFGKFDDSAEKNFCLRIKLLGDCYYCVSGVPDRDAFHADHCVQMGLDMIDIIRGYRESSRVNIDMRIGIHSGNVLSGLLGLRKWQFDIWSRDVTIASHMEQSGRPGCVHISRTTKDLLQNEYHIERGKDTARDEYLEKLKMDTFFIMPAKKHQGRRDALYVPVDRTPNFRRQSANRLQRRISSAPEVLSTRRRTVLSFSLMQFRLMVTQVNALMETAIDGMALSKKDQWLHSEGIQPFLLTFRDRKIEWPFRRQKDPLFKYSLLGVTWAACLLTIIGYLTKPRMPYFWIACSATFFANLVCIFCFWITLIWTNFMKSRELPFIKVFQITTGNVLIRYMCFLLLSVLLTVMGLMGMEEWTSNDGNWNSTTMNYNSTELLESAYEHPTFLASCVILSMTSVSLFLRIHFLLKVAVSGGIVIAYTCLVYAKHNPYRRPQLQDWIYMPQGVDHCWCLTIIWFLFHLLDRQVEYIGRLDYLWKRKLWKEQKEATLMNLVNKTLLSNILPEHVAKYYLDKDTMHLDCDLYHEEYTSVAVMFASIPNYVDFYSESFLNDEGRKCLQVLHEIICDFDKLLYESQFLKLEKIKTVGSTYMVAAGLQPGRNSSKTSNESSSSAKEDPNQNVMVLIKFAFAMVECLNNLNRNSWQDFKLRIGMAMGPVLAGVVGASKPQYDIWGDTVNIASRMDSTGVIGEIQVTKGVASVLSDSNKYDCKCRGKTFVKGKGWMTTYLVYQKDCYPAQETRL